MSYTQASVQEFLSAIDDLANVIEEAKDAAEEYIGALVDGDADDDEIALLAQTFDDTLDSLDGQGVQLKSILKEG